MEPSKRDLILERFNYHAPTDAQKVLLAECHAKIVDCAEFLVDRLPDGRDRAVALTSLEDAFLKCNNAITHSD